MFFLLCYEVQVQVLFGLFPQIWNLVFLCDNQAVIQIFDNNECNYSLQTEHVNYNVWYTQGKQKKKQTLVLLNVLHVFE